MLLPGVSFFSGSISGVGRVEFEIRMRGFLLRGVDNTDGSNSLEKIRGLNYTSSNLLLWPKARFGIIIHLYYLCHALKGFWDTKLPLQHCITSLTLSSKNETLQNTCNNHLEAAIF